MPEKHGCVKEYVRHWEKQTTLRHRRALESGLWERTQADKQWPSFPPTTKTYRLWFHSKCISTWASIELPCLCNVSFAEPGPLTNSRPDPIFISGWKDGVKEHPSSRRQRHSQYVI